MSNAYWEGRKLAKLTQKDVTAKWGRPDNSGPAHARRIAAANKIFELWYILRNKAKGNPKMLKALESLGRTGWGLGKDDDLEEAFQHLAKNNGKWVYEAGCKSMNAMPLLGLPNYVGNMPTSITNFATALNSKFLAMDKLVRIYRTNTQTIIGIQRKTNKTSSDWDNIGKALVKIGRYQNLIKEIDDFAPKSSTFSYGASKYASRITSLASIFSNIHSGVTTYYKLRGTGHSQNQALAMGALNTAIYFVPVLGTFYARMFEGIPKLEAGFKQIINQRVLELERVAQLN